MNLNRDGWRVKLFFLALGVWDEFCEKESGYKYDQGTNLCHFVRVICFYLPLVLACHLAVAGFLIWSLTLFPVGLFGVRWYLISTGSIIGAIFSVFGICKLIVWLMETVGERREEKWQRQYAVKYSAPRAVSSEKRPPEPSFSEILWTWITAKKRKICPQINFRAAVKGERQCAN